MKKLYNGLIMRHKKLTKKMAEENDFMFFCFYEYEQQKIEQIFEKFFNKSIDKAKLM